jgi:hypothetical protein
MRDGDMTWIEISHDVGELEVGFEYQRGEEPVFNLDSPMCGPGTASDIEIVEVWVNGAEIKAVMSDDAIEALGNDVLEKYERQLEDANVAAAAEAYEGRRCDEY